MGNISCSNTRAYKNLLLSLGLRNLINVPTRVATHSQTIIDHCVTNFSIRNIESGVIDDDISDHYPTFAIANLSVEKPKLTGNHFYRNFPHSKKPKFLDTLLCRLNYFLDWTCVQPISDFDKFMSILQLTADQIYPKIFVTLKNTTVINILGLPPQS